MTKKVLVTEEVAEEGIQALLDQGLEVDIRLGMTNEELVKVIPAYDALVVRGATQVNEAVLRAGKNLKVVGRAGVTFANIDIDTATECGIVVCNAPTSNIISAAEHTFALILACAKNIPAADKTMKAGEWKRSEFMGVELYGKTLAILGLGRVGRLVAARAKAFGMKVVAYDPYIAPDAAAQLGVKLYDSFDEIIRIADVITIHLPKSKETEGMFGPAEFASMKYGVILVNAACAGVFDMKALSDFTAAGKVFSVGVDMWKIEPVVESPLHEFDQAVLTPHLGASTHEARRRAGVQIAEYVGAALEGSIVPTALNIAPVAAEVMDALAPYVPACQIMGSMLMQLKDELPSNLAITACGDLADKELDILNAGLLDGMLSYHSDARVTAVNATTTASHHGINIENLSKVNADGYASKVVVNADGTTIACTISQDEQAPRIIELFGYQTNLATSGRSLIFEYVDGPGRIGIIGTVLGNAGISITTMQISKKKGTDNALVYMNVEQDVPAQVLKELRVKISPKNLWYIKL